MSLQIAGPTIVCYHVGLEMPLTNSQIELMREVIGGKTVFGPKSASRSYYFRYGHARCPKDEAVLRVTSNDRTV
jgi:hypothetical protein